MERRSQSDVNSSRRQFLKTSSVAALGGAFASPLVLTRSASGAGDNTLKVGLIGCGGRGTGAAAQALSTGEGVVLTAMGDAFEDRVQSSRKSRKRRSTRKRKVQKRKLLLKKRLLLKRKLLLKKNHLKRKLLLKKNHLKRKLLLKNQQKKRRQNKALCKGFFCFLYFGT